MTTRKSTRKYRVVSDDGTVWHSGISKTDASAYARDINADYKARGKSRRAHVEPEKPIFRKLI